MPTPFTAGELSALSGFTAHCGCDSIVESLGQAYQHSAVFGLAVVRLHPEPCLLASARVVM